MVRIVSGLAVAVLLLASCELVSVAEGESWAYTDPIQCLGNPWQRDWMERHNAGPADYSHDRELEIFRSYYERQGVQIFEVKTRRFAEVVCLACSCPTGIRYFVKTTPSGVERLSQMGFSRGAP